MTSIRIAVAFAYTVSLAGRAAADIAITEDQPTIAPTADAPIPFDPLTGERLTGDWYGGRPNMEDRGVTIDLGLTTIYQHNAHGGVRTYSAHRISGSYDLELTFDFEAMELWNGGVLYAVAEGSWDDGVSDSGYVGDLFGVNGDAGGDRAIDLTELWYEHSFFDGKFRVRLGRIDLGVDFETNAYANDEVGQFLNNGLVNAANVPMPDIGHGIQFVATPCEWFYFGAGVADAHADARQTGFRTAYHGPDDFFSIYEFGITPEFETAWGMLPGGYRFGLWYDPQPKEMFFNDLGGRRRTLPIKTDDVGFYASFDQAVFREDPEAEGDEQGLGLFCRYAYAHSDVNELEHFWSVGGQYQGLIPTRDDDILGFGVAQGVLSRELRYTGVDPRRETALEVYYSAQVLPWLTIAPDFQWILRPGGENERDAFVAGIRLQLSF